MGGMMARLRACLGEALLVAVLVANFAFGAVLILALRADMARVLLEDEGTRVSTKVGAYLWGKIVLFTTAMGEEGRGRGKQGIPPGIVGDPSVRDRLPPEAKFRRVRSGTGEWLTVYVGVPDDTPARGAVLPVAFQAIRAPAGERRFVIGAVSLDDLAVYLEDQRRQGIHCRIVDAAGNHLFGVRGKYSRNGRYGAESAVLDEMLPGGWTLQLEIPDVASRLRLLPQVLLASVIFGNAVTLLFLRRRFFVPHRRAVRSITETLGAHGETLPRRAD